MRIILLTIPLALLAVSAQAQSLQLAGKFGYLSEFELTATLNAEAANGKREYSGAMTIVHVGLCKHDGPDRKTGTIRLQIADAARATATLQFDGRKCSFTGTLSENEVGEINCPDVRALPASLWAKE
jgi:hypothetical protein